MSVADAPEADRAPGAPHPRMVDLVFGQQAAEAAFLSAWQGGRVHHAWLLTGPPGVGKATLAWRIARFLLADAGPAEEAGGGLFGDDAASDKSSGSALALARLDVPADHPVARRLRALSEPRLHLMRRGGAGRTDAERAKAAQEGRFSNVIRVDEVRDLARFIHLSATDSGRRVIIVDCADDLNAAAANALLKMLEEPPARTVMLLVAHQPAALLPTIRSRCRVLRLAPLGPQDMARALEQAGIAAGEGAAALAELSGGSAGAAVRLVGMDGPALYAELVALLDSLPQLDRPRALRLADGVAGRDAAMRLDLLASLVDRLTLRLARTGATGRPPATEIVPGEAALLARCAPTPAAARGWAACAEEIASRIRHGRAVNLDPAALVLDTVFKLCRGAAV